MPWVCCEAVSALPGALVGRLLHVCAMCTWHVGGAGFAPPFTTPTANAVCKVCGREGHSARTCPQRGTAIQPVKQKQSQGWQQGCSICGEPGHNAQTHAQHATAAAAAATTERTARGEYVCGYCQRVVSGKECACWLCQLFSVARDASPP